MSAKLKFEMSTIDRRLLTAVEEIVSQAPIAAHKVVAWEEPALVRLTELDDLKKTGILEQIKTYRAIVGACVEAIRAQNPQPDFERTTLDDELSFVDTALNHYNYRMDDEFKKIIRPGDIIEMYTLQGIQIYRNFEFFRYCSYDFLTLMTNDWTTLYERNDEVTKRIFESVGEVVKSPTGPRPFGVAPHMMRERYLKNRRVFEIYLDSVAAIFDKETGKVAGFVCNQRGSRMVSEGHGEHGADILVMSRKRG